MTTGTELKVPRLAESISEAVLAEWLKGDGASVNADEPVVTLETDKAAVEIAAPETGVLRHARSVGDTVVVGDVIARIEPGSAAAPAKEAPADAAVTKAPAAAAAATVPPAAAPSSAVAAPAGPAVRKLIEERGLTPGAISGSGRGGRILKEDVERAGSAASKAPVPPPISPPDSRPAALPTVPAGGPAGSAGERAVPMSRIRRRIAERLVQAQHTAAILTTFNEIDMSAVLAAREHHKEAFEKKHGVRLGFMSFFARASILALRETPELNAEIRDETIVYRDFVHLGVAVSTDRGLIVPVIRDAHTLGFAAVEREIVRLATRARDHTISLDELAGGTFTISNGGIYGSLLSTPILNPPQSGILGMHKIEKRPIVIEDQVVVRPMMYVALSYDHRIVDGEQAVTFLVRVKEQLEAPERMLLEV